MPTRMLHEKICDSVTLAELTAEEERLFHRLVVKADDYGRFHAIPSLLLGACFPLLIEKIEVEQVRAWRDRLADVGLIALYTVDGREYLQLVTWESYQRQRGSKPKFPPPLEGAEIRGELPQGADICGSRVVKTGLPEDGLTEDDRREPVDGARAPSLPSDHPTENGQAQEVGLVVPAPVAGFHSVLNGTQGYAPSLAFLEQVSERYGALDLVVEALKMADWLADAERNRRQKRATTKFMLNWLDHALEDLNGAAEPESRGSAPDELGGVALATPEDAASWVATHDHLRHDMNASYFERAIQSLEPMGRAADGGLVLRAPPGLGATALMFRDRIARALLDAGDAQGARVHIVEGLPGSAEG